MGAWEGGLAHITKYNNIQTTAALWEQWPALGGALDQGDRELKDLTGASQKSTKWQHVMHRPPIKRQRELTQEVMAAQVSLLHTSVPKDHSARLSACASAEGSVLSALPLTRSPSLTFT